MKKIYILVPLVLMGLFLLYYFSFAKTHAENERLKAVEQQRLVDEELTRKQEMERVAKADADRRSAERAAEEARKEAEKRKKWEDAGREIADTASKYNADADKFAKESAQLEIQLLELRGQKEQASRESFELAKRVEMARIAKRNAELQIQRMTEMIANKAAESAMAQVVAVPPPPTRR